MSNLPDEIHGFLPLPSLVFEVLLALADHERHGYGIIREVDVRTSGLIKLRTGTLYTMLQRLLEEGLIADAPARSAKDDDERRKYYELTALGRQVLRAEARRLASRIQDARRKHVLGRLGRGPR